MLLTDAIEEFIVSLQADGLSPATINWYRSILRSFAHAFAPRELESFTTNVLRSYIVKLRERVAYTDAPQKPRQRHTMSLASVDSHVTALHAFWAWCAREYRVSNPMQNIRRPIPRDREIKAIDHADFVRLFNATADGAIGARDRALLAFLADSGCRLGGLVSLKWENLDLEHRTARVMEKGTKLRRVVFTQMTARFLAAWRYYAPPDSIYVFTSSRPPYARLSSDGIQQVLKRLKVRARVEGRVNPHSFRHNFAREYLRNGGDLVSLARLLGHKDVKVTSDYYAVFSQDELAELHEKYSPLKGMMK